MFDTDHGYGGMAEHHGDQRTLGGYGSDTEQRPDDRSGDERRRGTG